MNSLTKPYDKRRYDVIASRLEREPKAWLPTEDLIAVLVANSTAAIPEVLLDHLRNRLDGTARKQRGRKKPQKLFDAFRPVAAAGYYAELLPWLRKRQKTCGLNGWSCIRNADWWQGPPHERAARMTAARWMKHADWRSVANIISKLHS